MLNAFACVFFLCVCLRVRVFGCFFECGVYGCLCVRVFVNVIDRLFVCLLC